MASKAIYDKFDEIDNRHAIFVKEMQVTNDLQFNRISKNDAEIEIIDATIAEIHNEIKDLKVEDEKLKSNIDENFTLQEKTLNEKYKKLLDK